MWKQCERLFFNCNYSQKTINKTWGAYNLLGLLGICSLTQTLKLYVIWRPYIMKTSIRFKRMVVENCKPCGGLAGCPCRRDQLFSTRLHLQDVIDLGLTNTVYCRVCDWKFAGINIIDVNKWWMNPIVYNIFRRQRK